MSALKVPEGAKKIHSSEIRPQSLGKVKLTIGALPKQEAA